MYGIDDMVDKEIVRAEKANAKYHRNEMDTDTIIDFINASSLKGIWQAVFQFVEDDDFQIDIDNAVRGL